ncbi:MAG: hypothetical protein IKS28_01730 [Clostridia bacterium]|nr:hypothetical protein [Clostridia bacterium]
MRKITCVLLIISMLACTFLSSCRTAETPVIPQTSGTEAAPAQETDPVPPETTAAPVSPDTEEPVTTEEITTAEEVSDDLRELLISTAVEWINSDFEYTLPDFGRFLNEYKIDKIDECTGFDGNITSVLHNDGVCTFSLDDGSKIHSFVQDGTRYGVNEDADGTFTLKTSSLEQTNSCPPSVFADFGIDISYFLNSDPFETDSEAGELDISELDPPLLSQDDVTVLDGQTAVFSDSYCLDAGRAVKEILAEGLGPDVTVTGVSGGLTLAGNPGEAGREAYLKFDAESPLLGKFSCTFTISDPLSPYFGYVKVETDFTSVVNGIKIPVRHIFSARSMSEDQKEFVSTFLYFSKAEYGGRQVDTITAQSTFIYPGDKGIIAAGSSSSLQFEYLGQQYHQQLSSINVFINDNTGEFWYQSGNVPQYCYLSGKIKFSEDKTKVNPAIYEATGVPGISS